MLSLDAVIRLHEHDEVEAHQQDQARYRATVSGRGRGREHRPIPELVDCRTCGRGFRPGLAWRVRFGARCADCCAPVERPAPSCSGSWCCVWPRGRCPTHDDGMATGDVRAMARSLGLDDGA